MHTALVGLALIAWSQIDPGGPVAPERTVTVCVETHVPTLHAELVATRIFRRIGVTLNWVRGRRACPADALVLSVTEQTPPDLLPGALAYAQPYEGTTIRVFADRVSFASDHPNRLCGRVLGHVFAHEIGHMLQGVSRHSAEGVMKGKWNSFDFSGMRARPLTFTDLDISLIHNGVDSRKARVPVTD